MSALSNRQRRLKRKGALKLAKTAPAKAKPVLALVAPPAPCGMAVRAEIASQAEAVERARLGADAAKVKTTPERGVEGYVRVGSRDGLLSLHRTKAITAVQAKAGLAYRLFYEVTGGSLGSGLGRAGEGRVARDWTELKVGYDDDGELALSFSAMDLHRSYVMARLNQIDRAVGLAMIDGRELEALRRIAGEGCTVREVAGSSGHARQAFTEALTRALDATAKVLRITGQ